MSRTKTGIVTLVLEADEDGNLDLVDCYDADGSRESHANNAIDRMTDVGWVRDDWRYAGTDMLRSNDELLMSAKLVVKGYSWTTRTYDGEYDGGFEVVEVVSRKPMIRRRAVPSATKAGVKHVDVCDCPVCGTSHSLPDDGSQKQVFDCGGETVVVYVEDRGE